MNKTEQYQYETITEQVTAEINGRIATLLAVEYLNERERTAGRIPTVRPLGEAIQNEWGFWVSKTPIGTRYYSNPLPVGYDKLVFDGYKKSWNWDTKVIVDDADLIEFRKRQPIAA